MSNAKTVMSQAANTWSGPTYIEDVFSTYLYTGTGTAQTITNGIDLAGEGGLVWIKDRVSAFGHRLFDTDRGVLKHLATDSTNAEGTLTGGLSSFNTDGFSIGNNGSVNTVNNTYASWTFRKAPRFFDVVTYTGTGSGSQAISHNLGVAPGCIITRRVNSASQWYTYHRSLGNSLEVWLNSSNAESASDKWNYTDPTDSVFYVNGTTNTAELHVAYLFAHDPLGPSGDGSDGLIACGSYTGGIPQDISLGWEPQWLLTKSATSVNDWRIWDNMRGVTTGDVRDTWLYANLSDVEGAGNEYVAFNADGFRLESAHGSINGASQTYIYIAIRRGPMRQPTSGTEVFAMDTQTTGSPNYTSGFVIDAATRFYRPGGSSSYPGLVPRLTSGKYLVTSSTAAEASFSSAQWDMMDGWGDGIGGTTTDAISHMFRRAPGFFDVVAYTGNGVAGRTVDHNLGVAPEMMIVKSRSSGTEHWYVYNAASGATKYMRLNQTLAETAASAFWNDTAPTSSVFTVGTDGGVNASAATYIAYLFATLPGVSKVGSYTGNGTSQTIDCGFTSGARFILIKRTDSTGDWYVWDTARGIVAANDPHLSLNTTAAEVTTDDSVDPDNSGFIVNQVAATNINVNAATYIFYAIA